MDKDKKEEKLTEMGTVSTTRMKATRLEKGLSQTDLAAAAQRLSPAEISKFERGLAIPYRPQAERIAAVLGLKPSELLERAEDPYAVV
jgi:transcriptional regulator with XRE-family HTH domain